MNDQYETGDSRVKITATAKGNQVEISIVAHPIAPDEEVEAAFRRVRGVIDATGQSELAEDIHAIGKYIGHLRSLVPDAEAAADLAARLHLKTAATLERDGGTITYDEDQKLLTAWVEMEEHDAANA